MQRSETTNLKLKKHDNVATNENAFDINNYLNGNWDKIDNGVAQAKSEAIGYLDTGSRNLFNAINANNGYFTKDTGVITVSDGWMYNYIKVNPNETYTMSGVSTTNDSIGISGFNANKGFVSGVKKYENGTFTIPSNIYIIGVSVRIADLNTFQIEKGSVATPYTPYTGKYLNEANYNQNTNIVDKNYLKNGKNLYNNTTMPLKNGLWVNRNNVGGNTNGWYVVVPIQGGKTYAISRKSTNPMYVMTTNVYPANGVAQVDSWRTYTQPITTSANANYLFIGLFAGTPTDTEKTSAIEELQVEEGSTTEYEPYTGKFLNEANVYNVKTASTSENGLMSARDKSKLNKYNLQMIGWGNKIVIDLIDSGMKTGFIYLSSDTLYSFRILKNSENFSINIFKVYGRDLVQDYSTDSTTEKATINLNSSNVIGLIEFGF